MFSYKTISLAAVCMGIAAADSNGDDINSIMDALADHDTANGLFSPAPPSFQDDSEDGQNDLPDKLCSDGEQGCGGTPDHLDDHDHDHDHDENEKFMDAGNGVEQNGSTAGMQAIAALYLYIALASGAAAL